MASPEPDPTTGPSAEIAVRATPPRYSLSDKLGYARALAESGLLPQHYRGNPANVLFSVEYGDMLGLAPMAALQGVHVIEGKPTASSALMSALVRRAGHRLRVKGDDQQATAQIIRSDDPGFVFEAVWTMKRAEQAGLTGKKVWKQYPAAMLKARAISEVARDACEEALLGLHYSAEELGAEVDEDGNPIQATATRVDQTLPTADRVTGEPDWGSEARRMEQARDLDGLRDLLKLAKVLQPTNTQLHANITAVGVRLSEAAKPAKTDDEVVDAEIVPEPTTQLPADDPVTVIRNLAKARSWSDDDLTDDFIARMGEHPDTATDDQLRAYIVKLNGQEQAA